MSIYRHHAGGTSAAYGLYFACALHYEYEQNKEAWVGLQYKKP